MATRLANCFDIELNQVPTPETIAALAGDALLGFHSSAKCAVAHVLMAIAV